MARSTAPDPLTVAGTTFVYRAYDNTLRDPLTPVGVAALDATGTTTLAMTTSDSAGNYTLAIATSGVPQRVILVYALATWMTSRLTIDTLLDRDIVGAGAQVWEVGDAPLWTGTLMSQVYTTAGASPRDSIKGTLNIAVRDCAGQPVVGASVAISPPPELVKYQATDGRPTSDGPTQAPFAHAFGFNAIAGANTITASAPGLTFQPMTVDVQSGLVNTLVIIHADS